MCVCVCVQMYKFEKTQGLQKMILSIVELFANTKHFGFF